MIQTDSKKPKFHQIQDWILQRIHEGTWEPGQAIDSVPKLSRTLGVSIATVSRAIEGLVARGILVTQFGSGTFVSTSALRKKILWITGSSISEGDISPYFIQSYDIGSKILHQYNMDTDSLWIGRKEHPTDFQHLSSGEILKSYSGVVLSACDPEHPVRHMLEKYDIPKLDLILDPHCVAKQQINKQCNKLLLDWEKKSCHAIVFRYHDSALTKRAGCLDIVLPELDSARAFEMFGFDTTWKILSKDHAPSHWLFTDDIVARGATRAILTHAVQNRNKADTLPKVVVVCSQNTTIWHGFPVDYILFDNAKIVESAILPFVGKLTGKHINQQQAQTVVHYVKWNDKRLLLPAHQ